MISQKETQELFNILKDEIEFDRDIVAISRILISQFSYNQALAEKNWQYILNNYNIKELQQDLDFEPILKKIPLLIIKQEGISAYLKLRDNLKKDNQFLTDNEIFCTSTPNDGIYVIIDGLITKENYTEEKTIINEVIKNSFKLPKELFEITEFLRNIIKSHITKNKMNLDLINELIIQAPTKKDQALLKTLLIAC